MKSTLSIALLCLVMACSGKKSGTGESEQASEKPDSPVMVGNDVDPSGCKGSAGYTWSAVKKKCIRFFEEGTPFEKYESTAPENPVTTAYVVLSDDHSKAEVFFGETDKPAVLEKKEVVEGETMPILFENEDEQLKIRFYKDTYQILFQDSIRFTQDYSFKNGLAEKLEKTK
ncbi:MULTISPECIES: hypothetical protein [Spirosoma]|uniref:Copper resistance protein NlpE n=1 Tax=Spirosoma sordidisoli TaxID=2502893 RepID=A0A4Q2UI38_9BACT|nr:MULTISPECIES: hypothetical protein [Spirosoma]RYC68854.1 hypothetical protein EQG79_15670 [Spirosoma sordidisoli]